MPLSLLERGQKGTPLGLAIRFVDRTRPACRRRRRADGPQITNLLPSAKSVERGKPASRRLGHASGVRYPGRIPPADRLLLQRGLDLHQPHAQRVPTGQTSRLACRSPPLPAGCARSLRGAGRARHDGGVAPTAGRQTPPPAGQNSGPEFRLTRRTPLG